MRQSISTKSNTRVHVYPTRVLRRCACSRRRSRRLLRTFIRRTRKVSSPRRTPHVSECFSFKGKSKQSAAIDHPSHSRVYNSALTCARECSPSKSYDDTYKARKLVSKLDAFRGARDRSSRSFGSERLPRLARFGAELASMSGGPTRSWRTRRLKLSF